jgi:hypothetical protein
MPWTIPNLLLHDKPALEYAEPRQRLPDHITFNDIQPRMVCSICDHRGADVSPSWLRSPSPMAASSAPYQTQAITLPGFQRPASSSI